MAERILVAFTEQGSEGSSSSSSSGCGCLLLIFLILGAVELFSDDNPDLEDDDITSVALIARGGGLTATGKITDADKIEELMDRINDAEEEDPDDDEDISLLAEVMTSYEEEENATVAFVGKMSGNFIRIGEDHFEMPVTHEEFFTEIGWHPKKELAKSRAAGAGPPAPVPLPVAP